MVAVDLKIGGFEVDDALDVQKLGEATRDGDDSIVLETVLLLRLFEKAQEQRVVQVSHLHDQPLPHLAFAAYHYRHLPLPHLSLPTPMVVAPKVQVEPSLHLQHTHTKSREEIIFMC